MKIDQETLVVLDRCTTSPCVVVLPPGQLERDLYVKVDKVLRAAGGKWNKRTKAHEFTEDATSVIEQALLTGEIGNPKQELGVFYTPPALARKAAQALRLDRSHLSVLEPEAGMGALALAADEADPSERFVGARLNITCLDILPKHVVALRALGFHAECADFLEEEPEQYPMFDRIIMNPPFAKQEDARHFLHALRFLKPGGRIVAIMSIAVTFRETKGYREIRQLVAVGGMGCQIIPLPPGSFKESSTMVNTALVIYDKPV